MNEDLVANVFFSDTCTAKVIQCKQLIQAAMEAVPQKINWVGIVRAHSNLGKGQIGAISSETYENKKRQKPDSELK